MYDPAIHFVGLDSNQAFYVIFTTVVLMWVFPAMAYSIFRYIASHGGTEMHPEDQNPDKPLGPDGSSQPFSSYKQASGT
jgi:hypothetical protein